MVKFCQSFGAACGCQPGATVTINSLAGYLCDVSADCADTVLELKNQIEAATGVAVREQRLLAKGHELDNHAKLGALIGSSATMIRRDPEQARFLEGLAGGVLRLSEAPVDIRADREVAVAALHADPYSNFAHMADELKEDRDLAELLVDILGGEALRQLPERFRADRSLVWKAVQHRNCHGALHFAANELKQDRGFILEALKQNACLVMELPFQFAQDQEMYFIALKDRRIVLDFCPCCGVVIPRALLENVGFLRRALAMGRVDVLVLAMPFNPQVFTDPHFFNVLLTHAEMNAVSFGLIGGLQGEAAQAFEALKRLQQQAEAPCEMMTRELADFDRSRRLRQGLKRLEAQSRKAARLAARAGKGRRARQPRGGRRKAGECPELEF